MIRLTEQQALSVHDMMIKATGGSGGVRDAGLLNSSPMQSQSIMLTIRPEKRASAHSFCLKKTTMTSETMEECCEIFGNDVTVDFLYKKRYYAHKRRRLWA